MVRKVNTNMIQHSRKKKHLGTRSKGEQMTSDFTRFIRLIASFHILAFSRAVRASSSALGLSLNQIMIKYNELVHLSSSDVHIILP